MKGKKIIDLGEYSRKNLPFFINKLEINEINDINDSSRMSVVYDNIYYKENKSFKLCINLSHGKPKISTLEHELKHLYDFMIKGGDFIKMKDVHLSAFTQMTSDDEIIYTFFILFTRNFWMK
jgi:hypothetical protein